MDACACDREPVRFDVPSSLTAAAPQGTPTAGICPRCLTVVPASAGGDPDFSRISDAFPDGQGGVALALAIGRLESLAGNRPAIEDALAAVERAGADPLLVIDRLLADPAVEPAIDLERRRMQLESMLY